MESFKQLGVGESYIKALADLKIKKPSEIQQKAIPYLLQNKGDLIGQAPTGTGKTIAFGLPLLHSVSENKKGIQGLVLAPTRELCQQIAKQLFKLTKYGPKIFTEAIYGGEKIEIQIANLKRPTQIVVATPGRLLDLIDRGAIDLSEVKTLILDEADEMLSMGFKDELERVMDTIHRSSAKWLFSATIPLALQSLITRFMNPGLHRISVSKNVEINTKIEHQFFICEQSQKFDYVYEFLKSQGSAKGIVFCRTRADTEVVARKLMGKHISADALHGDLGQRDRDKVMRAFIKGRIKVLVATDISARGVDVEDVAFVIHYQLPEQIESYTHRSGRTARAGKRGISICFVDKYELKIINQIEKTLKVNFIKI
ncbi:DEAD/DEAH box helicase [Arcticibacterium luteifluviistationis]|uniref:DEAD/DEAH box helicase n=1 Tax=Arcticibacterium luteifluviistationis TaxID=1784714 RepID=A0A2Z4GI62_9BACT|nr:DEAD/DEAH box helicase [Arcticibacterium luteifluviistationis]